MRADPNIPIGTFLSKLQYSDNGGKLPRIIYEDPTQPFHLAMVKMDPVPEGEEFMIFHVATYPRIRELAGICLAYFTEFKKLLGEEPRSMESEGVRCAFKHNKVWNALIIICSTYRYPESFLYNCVLKLSYVLSRVFPRPSYKAAQFAHKSLIWFMKAMASVEGISSVIATYKQKLRQKEPVLIEDDSLLVDVGPNQLVKGVLDDNDIKEKCSIFVFGRILYSTMDDGEITMAELMVANLNETTTEMETVDHKLYCLARHFHTVMVTISEPGKGLEKCCAMQVALMRLDAQGLITKMQQSFAKKLAPDKALDVLIVAGPFVVTHPPFIEAPIFADRNLLLHANAVAAEMYEKMMNPGFNCIVDYVIGNTDFQVKFVKHGDTMTFIHHAGPVDESEAAELPHMLKNLRVSSQPHSE